LERGQPRSGGGLLPPDTPLAVNRFLSA